MKETNITVLMVAPGEHPVITTLHNDLDSLQKAVSIGAEEQGLIEIVSLTDDVVLLCNEEGKLIGLRGNCRSLLPGRDGQRGESGISAGKRACRAGKTLLRN